MCKHYQYVHQFHAMTARNNYIYHLYIYESFRYHPGRGNPVEFPFQTYRANS